MNIPRPQLVYIQIQVRNKRISHPEIIICSAHKTIPVFLAEMNNPVGESLYTIMGFVQCCMTRTGLEYNCRMRVFDDEYGLLLMVRLQEKKYKKRSLCSAAVVELMDNLNAFILCYPGDSL